MRLDGKRVERNAITEARGRGASVTEIAVWLGLTRERVNELIEIAANPRGTAKLWEDEDE